MDKIIKKRASGKTSELIKRSFVTEYPILVATEDQKKNLKSQAYSMGYGGMPEPLTPKSFSLLQFRGRKIKVLVDEADYLLQQLLKKYGDIEIDTITLSPNDENSPYEKLRRAAQPLVDFLRDNYDPHTTAVVENDFVRIVRDDLGLPME